MKLVLLFVLLVVLSGCDSLFPCDQIDPTENELEIWALSVDGGSPTRLVDDLQKEEDAWASAHAYDFVGVTPDGVLLFYSYEDYDGSTPAIRARDLRTGAVIRLSFEPSDSGFVLSPDGASFAFVRSAAELWVAATDGSNARRVAQATFGPVSQITWVGNDRIAYSPALTGISVVSLADGVVAQLSRADSLHAFAVAPDLKSVAYTRSIQGWRGYPLFSRVAYVEATGAVRVLGEASRSADRNQIAFVSRGEQLAYVGRYGSSLILSNRDGTQPRVVAEATDVGISELRISPDGSRVVFLKNGQPMVLNVTTGQVLALGGTLPNDDLQWDSVSMQFGSPVLDGDGQTIYVLVEKRKWARACED